MSCAYTRLKNPKAIDLYHGNSGNDKEKQKQKHIENDFLLSFVKLKWKIEYLLTHYVIFCRKNCVHVCAWDGTEWRQKKIEYSIISMERLSTSSDNK